MSKKMLMPKYFDVYEKYTIGLPMTPGHWLNNRCKFYRCTVFTMTAGQGLGGKTWDEYAKAVPEEVIIEHAMSHKPLMLDLLDGRRIGVNLDYMVTFEDFNIVEKDFHSDNSNYPIGDYTCLWRLPMDRKKADIKFVNDYVYYKK